MDSVYSKRIRAGKRRTYFFDVRSTKGNDYFLTITESRKRFDDNGYDRHKIFLYKEDFNKFMKAMQEAVDYVKTELMPDFDFDAFNHEYPEGEGENGNEHAHGNGHENGHAQREYSPVAAAPAEVAEPAPAAPRQEATAGDNLSGEEVDKW